MRMDNMALPRSYRAAKHQGPELRTPLTVDLRDMIMINMNMITMNMRKTVITNISTGMLRTVLILKMTMINLSKRVMNIHKEIMILVIKTTIITTTITTSIPTLISMVLTA